MAGMNFFSSGAGNAGFTYAGEELCSGPTFFSVALEMLSISLKLMGPDGSLPTGIPLAHRSHMDLGPAPADAINPKEKYRCPDVGGVVEMTQRIGLQQDQRWKGLELLWRGGGKHPMPGAAVLRPSPVLPIPSSHAHSYSRANKASLPDCPNLPEP